MSRFYVPEPRIEGGMLKIEGDEIRHIRKVLRLRVGDKITVFDGQSREYEGPIVEESSTGVVVRIQNTHLSSKESPVEITLAQSLLKGEKMDFLIQKATELGIKEIIPFFSSRSVPRLEKSARLKRYQRWEKIAVGASKQCGRAVIPKIEPIYEYAEMLKSASPDVLRLLLWEREGTRLKKILEGVKEDRKIFFIVGPEGGLSQEEVEQAVEAGFTPIFLGERILRAETAPLSLLSILQYELGDMG
jgi:16S rRNA (uracil1498-N3)-methyltransferase